MSTEFFPLRISEIRAESNDAISILFNLPDDLKEEFSYRPGQHLTLRANVEGKDLRRNYSLCSAPHESAWRVAVKRLPGGRFSNWANDTLRPGDTIDVMPPTGSFSWNFNSATAKNYAFFGAGSGITPLLSMLLEGLEQEPRSRFSLFYGNRDSDNILFLEEIAALKDRYLGRLAVHHFLSREDDQISLFNGRIDQSKMSEILDHLLEVEDIDVAFVCGPEGMIDAVTHSLLAAGVPREAVLSERFSASDLSEAQKAAFKEMKARSAGKVMKVTIDGRARQVEFDASKSSILENVRAAGLRAPYSCESGVCATCRAKVTSGKVTMIRNFGLSEKEVEEGYILTCQAVPLSDNVALNFDG